ncbi:glycosyltransferase family 2 protein [Novosphingobium guangzhouense]|uniref:Glycosyl transferase family 2 n=1 Tax=Novosphingobium guangzhouense TaxID=1850347 RepID=A0A2K2G150_9SPHN|nr:glycosyltransferase family A protein [Novosphingobium guangzhouense]PNU04771.1 glycosyl transferase family 2 [Novosphingobium guangzhouense]
MTLRIHVVFATVGRAQLLARTVDHLADQTRLPDGVIISATCPEDAQGLGRSRIATKHVYGDKGLCRQRNRALRMLEGQSDIVVFLDDDFVPHNDYLAVIEETFRADQGIVGATGDLLADGIHGDEIAFDAARDALARHALPQQAALRPRKALYGCNMAIRLTATQDLWFDEALPLYGWQEDIDFTHQLLDRGRLVSGARLAGIHLGTRSARTSGRRLGYSQVANLVHLWRKGTMQPGLGHRLLAQNLASNAVRSLFPEPHIDRRGRLVGNLMALRDLAVGRIDPRRVETM